MIPYPANVVGLDVILDHAGVTMTAVPALVILPLASTVKGVTYVDIPLYVPATTPELARVAVVEPAATETSPDTAGN
jgi:hypothetical protein